MNIGMVARLDCLILAEMSHVRRVAVLDEIQLSSRSVPMR